MPPTSWSVAGPSEYGFYSNVNPNRPHPRWSQAKERKLTGERSLLDNLFQGRVDTVMFNGYGKSGRGFVCGDGFEEIFLGNLE